MPHLHGRLAPAIPALMEVMTRIPPLMSLRTRPTPWLRVPWGWWVKRRRRSTRWKASPTTLIVDTEDIPTVQAETPTSLTAAVSAANSTVQAETPTSLTTAVSAASPTVQAETPPA